MHDVANRLTTLHDRLNQYVYLNDNLDELRTNVEQIKVQKLTKKKIFVIHFLLLF